MTELSSSTNLGFSDYPYQELVYGLVANPPTADGHLLWRRDPCPASAPRERWLSNPSRGTRGLSAHLEDGSAVVPSPQRGTVAP